MGSFGLLTVAVLVLLGMGNGVDFANHLLGVLKSTPEYQRNSYEVRLEIQELKEYMGL
jgi:hypothetical protein